MAYGDFKDFSKRATSDKLLCNKSFNIAKNSKCGSYQKGLASMVYNFFDKKVASGAVARRNKSAIKSKNILTQRSSGIAKGLHKPIIKKI